MIGLLGIILFEAKKMSDNFKENIEITLILKEDATQDSLTILQNFVNVQSYTKKIEFVSKDKAAEQLKADLGEDFQKTLGYNPLFNSYSLHLKADYANKDSLQWIQEDLIEFGVIKEVFFHKSLVDSINDNVKKIGFILGPICLIFLFIAFNMIGSTLRWSIYSNRLLVKSMQLVGATDSFIKRPFIKQSLINGLISGIIAVTLLNVLLFFIASALPELHLIDHLMFLVIWLVVVVLIGLLISWFSTTRSLSKFLNKPLDELY
jgi:cell division transport system permease protein